MSGGSAHVLVVGLGKIGLALARALVRSQRYSVIVWNRSVEKGHHLFTVEEQEEDQVQWEVAESLEEGLRKAELIVFSLCDYAVSYQALGEREDEEHPSSGLSKLLSGKVVLQLA